MKYNNNRSNNISDLKAHLQVLIVCFCISLFNLFLQVKLILLRDSVGQRPHGLLGIGKVYFPV